MFTGAFDRDINSTEVNIMVAIQMRINTSIFAEKSGSPAWKQLTTRYQVSENDHMIPPHLQKTFRKRDECYD